MACAKVYANCWEQVAPAFWYVVALIAKVFLVLEIILETIEWSFFRLKNQLPLLTCFPIMSIFKKQFSELIKLERLM